MNLNELRDILYDFPDTPANRNELCEELVATNASDMVWEYADRHIPGLEEWWERQIEIEEKLALHNNVFPIYFFDMMDLHGAYLRNAGRRHTELIGADLIGADLQSANLSHSDFSRSDFWGANLRFARLRSTDLSNSDLSHANLSRTQLNFADLRGADLEGANLSGAVLIGALYDDSTVFPEGFDPESRGMVYEDESE